MVNSYISTLGTITGDDLIIPLDLSKYKYASKFGNHVDNCFAHLVDIVKARNEHHSYVGNMEANVGLLKEKFELLNIDTQKEVLYSKYPIRTLRKVVNIILYSVFATKEDREDFEYIMNSYTK